MTPASHIDIRKEIHYNIYGGRHQEGKKPTMKDNNKNKTTTTTETTVSEEESLRAWDAYVESILDDLYGESGECTVGFDF